MTERPQFGRRVPPPQNLPPPINARRAARKHSRTVERVVARRLAFGVTIGALALALIASTLPTMADLPPWLAAVAEHPAVQQITEWRSGLQSGLAEASAGVRQRVSASLTTDPESQAASKEPLPKQSTPQRVSALVGGSFDNGVAGVPVAVPHPPPADGPLRRLPTLPPLPASALAESVTSALQAATTPGAVPHPNPPTAPARLAVLGTEDRPLVPGQLRQLTQDHCCGGAWWSADSRGLQYIDRPAGSQSTVVYRIALWPPGSQPQVVDLQVAEEQTTQRFSVRLAGNQSIVKDRSTGREWPLATGGSPVTIAGDGTTAVWWDFTAGRAQVDSFIHIHTANLDGTGERELTGLWGAEVNRFLPDHRRVLVHGRTIRESTEVTLGTLDVATGDLVPLARGSWLGDVALSPDGRWVVYTISLDRANPDANGIWIVGTDGGAPRKLPFIGAYRWRDTGRLVYIPMEPGAAAQSLWQYDAPTGQGARLFDPAKVPLKIANNDWSISPDGLTLAFVAVEDRDLWGVDLP